jgi:acyl-homoserine lactone synthase
VIVIVKGNDVSRHAEISEQALRLRHRIFVEELGWSDLRRPDGREIDQFDHEEAIHHHCIRDGRVVGYQRLLPTTRPHLLTDVMPELCDGPPPTGPTIFEWTRNCVAPEWRDSATGVSQVSFELTLGVVEWGLSHGIDTVTVAYEPQFLLRALQMQFLVRPLGYQRVMGSRKAVAVSMTFNERTLWTLQNAYGSCASVLADANELALKAA